jgi:predicted Rdx family selenoprotein
VIDAVEVVPATGGIFEVHIDGELLFTKAMLGRYPRPKTSCPLLREHIH